MPIIDGQWYNLPDGPRVQLSTFGPAPGWYLLADAGGVLDYGVYASGMRQFLYDWDLGDYRAVSCDPTVDDLRPA